MYRLLGEPVRMVMNLIPDHVNKVIPIMIKDMVVDVFENSEDYHTKREVIRKSTKRFTKYVKEIYADVYHAKLTKAMINESDNERKKYHKRCSGDFDNLCKRTASQKARSLSQKARSLSQKARSLSPSRKPPSSQVSKTKAKVAVRQPRPLKKKADPETSSRVTRSKSPRQHKSRNG
jgi:hypothetical protein